MSKEAEEGKTMEQKIDNISCDYPEKCHWVKAERERMIKRIEWLKREIKNELFKDYPDKDYIKNHWLMKKLDQAKTLPVEKIV